MHFTGNETVAQLKAMRAEALAKAQGIVANLQSKAAGPTPDEQSEFDALTAKISAIDERVTAIEAAIKAAKLDPDTPGDKAMELGGTRVGLAGRWTNMSDLKAALGGRTEAIDHMGRVVPIGGGRMGSKGRLALGRKSDTAADISTKMTGRDANGYAVGVKDISAVAGTHLADILTTSEAKRLGSAPVGLIDVIQAVSRGAVSRYLRQTARTGGADIVAPGGLKPTLGLKLEPIDSELEVVAVLSEPLDKFVLEDQVAATDFVQAELLDAIKVRLEKLLLDTLNAASGIGVQAWDAAGLFATIRKGRLLAENLGYSPTHIALHPTDWAAVELTTDSQERYQLEPGGVPVDLAALKLWGLEVVTSTKVTVGTGWVFDNQGLAIGTDGKLAVEWDRSGDLFKHNQIQARAEIRAAVELYQPGAVVKVDLTA